jgi:hypothetical protein
LLNRSMDNAFFKPCKLMVKQYTLLKKDYPFR